MYIISIISLVLSILSLCKIPNDFVAFTLFIIFGLIFCKSFKDETDWRSSATIITAPKLTFHQFIILYEAMTNNFILDNCSIFYKPEDTTIYLKTFIDFLKYKHFKNNIKKYEIKMNQLNRQAELIKALHRDLANKKKENDDFVKQKLKEHIIDLKLREKLENERSDSKQDP